MNFNISLKTGVILCENLFAESYEHINIHTDIDNEMMLYLYIVVEYNLR